MGRVLSCQGHNKAPLIGARGSVELYPCPPPHMSLLEGTRAEPRKSTGRSRTVEEGIALLRCTCTYDVCRQYGTDGPQPCAATHRTRR